MPTIDRRAVDPDAVPSTEKRPIGFWLKLADRLIDESFEQLLEAERLTRRHWQVLNVLHRGPATPGEIDLQLAPFLGPDATTTGPLLDDLQARAWTESAPGNRLSLTPSGETALAALLVKIHGHRSRIVSGISAEEYQAIVGGLRRIATNLGWREPFDTPQGTLPTDNAPHPTSSSGTSDSGAG